MKDKKGTLPLLMPFLVLGAGVIAVSTGATIIRLAEAPALVISAYRVGLASLLLFPFACHYAKEEIKSLTLKDLKVAVASGAFLSLHFAFWISSLDYTTVASSVVLVNTNPIWVALLTPFMSSDRLRGMSLLGVAFSVIGSAVISAGDFALGGKALYGDFLAIAGSWCAAFYLLFGRRLRQKLSLLSYITICYSTAAVILFALIVCLGYPLFGYPKKTWLCFWGLALFPQIIGHSSYNWSLKYFSAGFVAIALLGEPVVSPILAYFALGEAIMPITIFGGSLVLAGIVLAALGENRGKQES
ncbi:DMT family transporter [Acetomicrobium sp. UBA5826]|uniref:DMT family transporter n=1 Tax=Acetomicrobium sp. UBA5826 TaxID=1946039 RepID=UPI002580B454|nr:DMT family transporter [Acetomicrobium sp. UBA5826]